MNQRELNTHQGQLRLPFVALLLLVFSVEGLSAFQGLNPAGLYSQYAKAVVLVLAEKDGVLLGQGSGAVVSEDGLVISALHVIQGADHVVVKLQSSDIYDNVSIVAVDPRRDIVILRIPGFDLPTIPLGNSNEVKVGEPVVLISNPQGLEQSIAEGVVSAVRSVEKLGGRIIQTSIPASPGSSGGPILNTRGEIIAVLSFKLLAGENLNFGIPINYVRGILGTAQQQTPFSLSELSERISDLSVRPVSEMGRPAYTDISGEWLSLMSSNRYRIRLEGEFAYIERVVPEEAKRTGGFTLCDHKKLGERYEGSCRAGFPVFYGPILRNGQRAFKNCLVEGRHEILRATPTRIEGRVEVPTKDIESWSNKDLATCGRNLRKRWLAFVWVRPD